MKNMNTLSSQQSTFLCISEMDSCITWFCKIIYNFMKSRTYTCREINYDWSIMYVRVITFFFTFFVRMRLRATSSCCSKFWSSLKLKVSRSCPAKFLVNVKFLKYIKFCGLIHTIACHHQSLLMFAIKYSVKSCIWIWYI